jgi:hypothetical protein
MKYYNHDGIMIKHKVIEPEIIGTWKLNKRIRFLKEVMKNQNPLALKIVEIYIKDRTRKIGRTTKEISEMVGEDVPKVRNALQWLEKNYIVKGRKVSKSIVWSLKRETKRKHKKKPKEISKEKNKKKNSKSIKVTTISSKKQSK